MIVLVDDKKARGGGEVVLDELGRRLAGVADVRLAVREGAEDIFEFTGKRIRLDTLARRLLPNGSVVVCNTNSALPWTLRAVRQLRNAGCRVALVAIVHSYPRTVVRELTTRELLRRADEVIVVEPGLASRLASGATIPPWLGPLTSLDSSNQEPIQFSGCFRSYARPDPSKGLHLLAPVYRELEERGYGCEIAIGTALQSGSRYERHLRVKLARWLVDGPRSSSWVRPGDIFLVPSISGEAVCLAAQEVMLRGALVVASRLGLLAYLDEDWSGRTSFRPNNSQSMIACALGCASLSRARFSEAVASQQGSVIARSGRWYETVVDRILSHAS